MNHPQTAAHPLRFTRYQIEYEQPMLALHRSALEGFSLGISRSQDEADLRDIERVYLRPGGEFLVGFMGARLMAMGGFERLPDDMAELRRMRIAQDLQARGYGTLLLRELERRALQSGIRTLCLEAARIRTLTLAFYRKHRYRECGRSSYGAIETVPFTKTLDNRACDCETNRPEKL